MSRNRINERRGSDGEIMRAVGDSDELSGFNAGKEKRWTMELQSWLMKVSSCDAFPSCS